MSGAPKQAQQQQAPIPTQREHQRILAAYNGAYEDPKLEGLLNQMVAKLVAASERPDVHYRVTILNSAAVNAFALPTGQLYVTRGLIALANDTSELASVLSHEMSHVIARHAAIREDQARQVALVSRVVQDVLSDPETGALALAKSKIALASFSRAQEFEADGIGVGIASRAGYDPYGAVRFLTSMGRNAELKTNPSQSHIDPRSPDFLSSHPATPERVQAYKVTANARVRAVSANLNCAKPSSASLICWFAIALRNGMRPGHSNVCCAVTDHATPSPKPLTCLLPSVADTSGFARVPAVRRSPLAAAISAR